MNGVDSLKQTEENLERPIHNWFCTRLVEGEEWKFKSIPHYFGTKLEIFSGQTSLTSGYASLPKGGGKSISPHWVLHINSAVWSNLAARSRTCTDSSTTTETEHRIIATITSHLSPGNLNIRWQTLEIEDLTHSSSSSSSSSHHVTIKVYFEKFIVKQLKISTNQF